MLLHFAPAPPTSPWGGVLVVHSSAHAGVTSAAADIAAALLRLGLDVDLHDVAGAVEVDPDRHDVVIVGASLDAPERRELSGWIAAHRRALDDRPTALFTVCPAAWSERMRHEARRGLEALAVATAWRPARARVIADACAVDRFADDVAILAAAPLAA